ncbi:hypothetical protein [Streptomyces sp. NPDC052012]|uniref:hypothetical protein n=1 Tax=Streptomyces sp. NPDC052012 TaxID=3155051 RepID=UPI00344E1DD2
MAGCSAFGTAEDTAGQDGVGGAGRTKVALVTHGGDDDAFSALVQKGAEAPAAEAGVELTYASDADPVGQARLVRGAIREVSTRVLDT